MGTFDAGARRSRSGSGRVTGGPIRPVYEDEDFRRAKPDYKTEALCKLAARVISLALTGECADPLLQALLVEGVYPAPHGGRVLVRVLFRPSEEMPGVAEVILRLEKVRGLLRARIAEASSRKRTPELAFDAAPMGLSGATPPTGSGVDHG